MSTTVHALSNTMIALFTDFGHDGLYVGQMHALIGAALT